MLIARVLFGLLSGAECRIGRLAPADDALDGDVAGRLGELREFVQAGVEAALAEVDADEDRARRLTGGRTRMRVEARLRAPRHGGLQAAASGVSPAWKLTGRPGTTVEMACL